MDLLGLPPSASSDTKIFTGDQNVTNLQWQTWIKPRGKTMCRMLLIGAGGGGGGGAGNTAGSTRGGGGSGSSGAMSRFIGPVQFLPDVLYIQLSEGGAGGAGGNSGNGSNASNSLSSFISVYPDNVSATNILLQATGSGGFASGGTSAAGGAGGTGGTINTAAQTPLAGFGMTQFVAGQNGVIGGSQAGGNGNNVSIPVTQCIVMGGTSGAGSNTADFDGGSINAISNSFLSQYAPSQALAGGNDGGAGIFLWKPMWGFSGMGGSSSNSVPGGNGGNAAYGSGGGGGAAGVTTGGNGGRGGAGLCIITCW